MWATGSQNTPNQALQQTGHAALQRLDHLQRLEASCNDWSSAGRSIIPRAP